MSGDDWLKSPYDEIVDRLRTATGADAAVVLFIGGKHGSGVSVRMPSKVLAHVPKLLRAAAQSFEEAYAAEHGPQITCPVCQGVFTHSDALGGPRAKPAAGDFTICGGCATFLRFASEATLRIAEQEEIALLDDDERNALVRARKEIERRKR